MRRTALFALMISFALLWGCGHGTAAEDEARIETLRTEIGAAETVSFTAELLADGGKSAESYSLRCTRTAEEMCMDLLSPELIAGVTARLRDGEATLHFDGLSLEAGTVDSSNLTPIAAPAAILEALERGVVSQLRREEQEDGGEVVAFRVMRSETEDVDFWLDGETLTPLYAEIVSDGRMVISCGISDWSMD